MPDERAKNLAEAMRVLLMEARRYRDTPGAMGRYDAWLALDTAIENGRAMLERFEKPPEAERSSR